MGRGKNKYQVLNTKEVLFKTTLKKDPKPKKTQPESSGEWWQDKKYSTPVFIQDENIYYDSFGEKILYIHKKSNCRGRPCPIHNPSNHSMKNWPTHWNMQKKALQRICEHGIAHPDPDDYNFRKSSNQDLELFDHDCDGCCQL